MANRTTTVRNVGGVILASIIVVLIGLKLTHYVDWSWLWVLSPLWIPLALAIVVLCFWVVVTLAMIGHD